MVSLWGRSASAHVANHTMRTGHFLRLLSSFLLCSNLNVAYGTSASTEAVVTAKPSSTATATTDSTDTTPLYKNPNAPIEDRVNDLIGRMTLEEKVAQMCDTSGRHFFFIIYF